MFSCISTSSLAQVKEGDNRCSILYATKEGADLRTFSFWPGGTARPSDDADFRRDWLTCLLNSPDGKIHLHPSLAVPADRSQAPLVYIRRAGEATDAPVASLAVLGARTRRVRPLPRLPYEVSLRERYLVADQVVGEDSVEALTPLLEAACQLLRTGEADQVCFDDVEVGSPLWNLLAERSDAPGIAVFYPVRPQPRWRLRCSEEPEDFWKMFSSRNRENFRRRLRKFPHQIRCYREPSEVREFLEKAHEVSRKSWQSRRNGLRIANHAEDIEWWERIAALGGMRSYLLEHEGKPVAFELSTQWNGTFLGQETGYDQEFARFGPGTVLLVRALEDLFARDRPRLIDFSWGDAEYKRDFSNERTLSGRVLLVRRAMKPLLVARLQQIRQSIAEFVLAGLHRSSTLTRLARKWRHRSSAQ